MWLETFFVCPTEKPTSKSHSKLHSETKVILVVKSVIFVFGPKSEMSENSCMSFERISGSNLSLVTHSENNDFRSS